MNRNTARKTKPVTTKGFTTIEVLVAVGILVILFALLAPNLIKAQRDLRQKELDAKAETIYIAAQNELVKLRASGQSKKYAMSNHLLINKTGTGLGVPSDMIPELDENDDLVQDLHFFRKNDPDEPAGRVAQMVMNGKTVSSELLDNHWVIEYDPTNCSVYAVYYSEAQEIESDYESDWSRFNGYRNRESRYNDGAWVGYYGGNASSSSASTTTLNPSITVTNTDKLSAHMQCKIPLGTAGVTFTLQLTDGAGNTRWREYRHDSGAIKSMGMLYWLDLTFDDLSKSATLPSMATRFQGLYGSTAGPIKTAGYDSASRVSYIEWSKDGKGSPLVPGTSLKLELTVSSSNNLIEPGTATAQTNSLFGDNSTSSEAHILYGRHLQNLDTSSGVNSNIKSATQKGHITFKDNVEADDDWYSYYSNVYFNGITEVNNSGITTANFKPIKNDNLKLYDGNSLRISGLNVSVSSGNAALLDSIAGGVELKNVSLVGANVSSSGGTAAGLLGSASGDSNRITNCLVYLDRSDYSGKTNESIWLSGSNVGGLVGKTTGGSLDVSNCLASTVINGSQYASGLVGVVEGGSLSVSTSYADSYITGKNIAGLASGSVHKLSNCYAAGFLTADSVAAGLVNGRVDEAESSYTICTLESSKNNSATCYGTAAGITTTSKVYYFVPSTTSQLDVSGTQAISTMSSADLKAELGDAFTTATTNYTSPYNLKGQALITYTYPRLTINRHYGDWQADFESGSLVYYEKYQLEGGTSSYGFYGANVAALRDDGTIVGDGYGVVYKQTETVPQAVRVTTGGQVYSLDMTNYLTVVSDGIEYHIYTLPKEALNTVPQNGAGFYHEALIETSVAGSTTEVYGFNPHFAKTAIHVTPEAGATVLPSLEENAQISVRTARHLYAMSLYYDDHFRDQTSTNIFAQESNINYSVYDWGNFTTYGSSINQQEPIGRSSQSAFLADYDGGCHTITDVSFVSEVGDFVGLFGYNAGSISNVVLATNYDANDSQNHFLVKRNQHLTTNDVVCMGVLAGFNSGTIQNCAVAGYYIAGADGTLHAYANSTLYAGGLVGANTGIIRNSTADCPAVRLSSLYAQVRLGGFVGRNEANGRIQNCYDLAYVEVAESRGGQVNAAGFAGANEGRIVSSYCATAIVTSGETATSYAFAPKGGIVSDCYYLDQGTYRYIYNLYSYKGVADRTSGQSTTYEDLRGAYASTKAANSYYAENTDEDLYPFRAVLTDASGAYVHYGDWVFGPILGDLGVFYWEYEEGGSNSGYHITYLGTSADMSDSGTTLCTAHDDGGIVTDYGYGYYVDSRYSNRITVSADGLNTSFGAFGGPGSYNEEVAAALKSQIKAFTGNSIVEYTFYPYTTRVTNNGEHVFLDNGEGKTGTWTLAFTDAEGTTHSYEYEIAPFFANAMRRKTSSPLNMTASDWRVSDFSLEPGLENNVFEVRSVQQFQYINWNYNTKNCTTLVYGEKDKDQSETGIGNYKDFPYLQYATVLKKGTQKKSDVIKRRPERFWVQSHDLHGSQGQVLTPIAGMATSTPVSNTDYQNILFAWFGGSYDGQSYKIQNTSVVSEAYTVGLFGATAGASIKNVIMFADDGVSTVERSTAGKRDFESATGAYCLGGLIGMAYEYQVSGGTVIPNAIENCAIAGYRVKDSSTNQQGAGTANVGGLIGFANVNLINCSSVVDTIIASTHEYGHMAWGSYYRIGGLAGSAGCPGNVSVVVRNCYTGGSITVDDVTLNEEPDLYDSAGFALRDQSNVGHSSNLFIAGIIGGSYAPNISNFSNQQSNSPDGIANIENCYTYIKLPDLKGTIRAISLIAGQADRYCRKSQINVTNCYYLEGIDDIGHPDRNDPRTWPSYYFTSTKTLVSGSKLPTEDEWQQMLAGNQSLIDKYSKRVISEEEFNDMLMGDLTCLTKYLNPQSQGGGRIPDKEQQDSITYEVLRDNGANMLNNGSSANGWSKVPVVDNAGARIDGKYSFSNESSQTGKNYPFPAIITQKDNTYSTRDVTEYVNVHYGAWPLDGWYWENGRDSMDIFQDMENGEAIKTFTLYYKEEYEGAPVIEIDDNSIATVSFCEKDEAHSCYHVGVKALTDGFVTVKATAGSTTAEFVLSITAKLQLSSNPAQLELYKDVESPIEFTAEAALPLDKDLAEGETRKSYSTAGTWSMSVLDSGDAYAFDFSRQGSLSSNVWKVTSYASGDTLVRATFTYKYGETTFSESMLIPVNTKGVIGFSNGTDYVEATRVPMGEGEARNVHIEDMGAPTDYQMFLYATKTDGDLDRFEVASATITMAEGSDGNPSDYAAFFNNSSEIVSGADYQLLQGYVLYTGNDDSPEEVTVTVTLNDPNGQSSYALSITVAAEKQYIVHFDSNNADDGLMQDELFQEQTDYHLPDCEFTRIGYTFQCWEVNGEEKEVGDTITVTGYTVVKALWQPNPYVLHLNPNGATGSIADANLIYDVDYELPQVEGSFAYANHEFKGWNTAADGSGDSYADGATVRNLTSSGETTLYAQWASLYRLTLMYKQYGQEEAVCWEGIPSDGLNGYQAPQVSGWDIEGWYTTNDANGVKVLDASGSVAQANISGYTNANSLLDLAQDSNLYARWSRSETGYYVRVESLNASEDDNGTYLVANTADSGSVNLLSIQVSGSSYSITNSTGMIYSGGLAQTGGGFTAIDYLIDPPAVAQWNVEYRKDNTKDNVTLRFYSFESELYNKRYLRGTDDSLETKDSPYWQSGYSNKQMWTYGVRYPSTLQSEYQFMEKTFDRALYWNGSKWTNDQKNMTSYLFKYHDDTLYSYEPVAL